MAALVYVHIYHAINISRINQGVGNIKVTYVTY